MSEWAKRKRNIIFGISILKTDNDKMVAE